MLSQSRTNSLEIEAQKEAKKPTLSHKLHTSSALMSKILVLISYQITQKGAKKARFHKIWTLLFVFLFLFLFL